MTSLVEREADTLWEQLAQPDHWRRDDTSRGLHAAWCLRYAAASPPVRLAVVRRILGEAIRLRAECHALEQSDAQHHYSRPCHFKTYQCLEMIERSWVEELPWTDNDVTEILRWWDGGFPHWLSREDSARQLVKLFERIGAFRLPAVVAWARGIHDAQSVAYKPDRTLLRDLQRVLGLEARLATSPGEPWSEAMQAELAAMDSNMRRAWNDLLLHVAAGSGSMPTGKWAKTARTLAGAIDRDAFVTHVEAWFALSEKPRTLPVRVSDWLEHPAGSSFLSDASQDVLKGLCWTAGVIGETRLTRALGRMALSSFRKLPGIGPRAVRIGNAAIHALGVLPGSDALGQLAMLRVKVKFGGGVKALEKALAIAAERAGISREDVDELGVPTYGLTGVGVRVETLGDVTARLVLHANGKSELTFVSAKGKTSKSAPAATKSAHAEDLAELKLAAKDAAVMLSAQRDRLDGMFLLAKSWPFAIWRERYLDHPLVGILARNLIWNVVEASGRMRAVVQRGDQSFVDAQGQPVEIVEDGATVRLWHPIDVDVPSALAWRRYFEDHDAVQPFKQAHREIYLLTDAERGTRTYSNRFAAHVLRQHQFHALCAARGWDNKLRLLVDDSVPPATRRLTRHGMRAEFWVESVGNEYGHDTNGAGAFLYLTTDQVRFYAADAPRNEVHATGGGYAAIGPGGAASTPLELTSIPPLVLSEVLRDVDLFVGVASVGANPEWHDGGPGNQHRTYWWDFSFGDLSISGAGRRELLQRLIPRLAIAPVCSFDERFLIVQGKLRRYRIHLGSGNILMDPNDQYLCIVPTSAPAEHLDRIRLPFEGDRLLSIVLSKAFLLAADDEIVDESIVRQIRV